jgi:4-aminobutyrate aminotransferase-like enzyme
MVLHLVKSMLKRGFILLPEGATGHVLAFTPPLTITRTQLSRATTVLENLLRLS